MCTNSCINKNIHLDGVSKNLISFNVFNSSQEKMQRIYIFLLRACTAINFECNVSWTRRGYTCQKWSSQTPHRHEIHNNIPGVQYEGVGDHNFCRKVGGADKPWCYTTDPNVRFDYCSDCKPDFDPYLVRKSSQVTSLVSILDEDGDESDDEPPTTMEVTTEEATTHFFTTTIATVATETTLPVTTMQPTTMITLAEYIPLDEFGLKSSCEHGDIVIVPVACQEVELTSYSEMFIDNGGLNYGFSGRFDSIITGTSTILIENLSGSVFEVKSPNAVTHRFDHRRKRLVGKYMKGDIITFDGLKTTDKSNLIVKMCPGDAYFEQACAEGPKDNCLSHCWKKDGDFCIEVDENMKTIECMSEWISVKFDPCLAPTQYKKFTVRGYSIE